MYYLIVTFENGSHVAFPLTRQSILVGRDAISDIFLSHPSVSRDHSRIFDKGGVFLGGGPGQHQRHLCQ